ncbi:zinc finger protein 64 homolog, isoforms 1 and 2 isoform X2 [Eurytemora carolleeae]|nr:zinc finger protein 64 homolog, isoforms 1 and 2 isoform X2 [Eurytemora carolleeae]|eukprot:XP_023333413.1 zinc finger protein 64 homolog, isoforms 1 and 2-like isoform X2 [Eurytemora affinis]
MGFSKKQKLKYHMRTHTGEGLKSCIICDKVFTHSYALNSHVRIHQKENQFMCYVCKKNGIKTKEDLYSHLGEHGSGDFQCTECDAVFRFSKLLNRHVLTVHKQLKGFQCSAQTCNYRTAYIQHIREHTQESHSVKNPQCPTHFLDHHNSTWILEDDKCNVLEEDLYSIYECLDPILDQHVLGSEYKEEEAFTNVKEEREDADERDGEGFTDENESENAGNNLEDGGIEHEDDTKEQEEGEDELEREDDQEVVELEGLPVKQEYIE